MVVHRAPRRAPRWRSILSALLGVFLCLPGLSAARHDAVTVPPGQSFLAPRIPIVAWGYNKAGQTTVPANLSGVGVSQVAGGGNHTVALKSDGTVVAWGSNYFGQSTVPNNLSGVIQVAAGGAHTVVLKQYSFLYIPLIMKP